MMRKTFLSVAIAAITISLVTPAAHAGKGGGSEQNLSQQQLLLLYAATHKQGPDNSQVGVSPFVPPAKGGGGEKPLP